MKKAASVITCLVVAFIAGSVFAIEIGEYNDPAKQIKSEAGKIIIITLQSNKTTGYEWQLSGPLAVKVVDFMKSEYIVNKSRLMGSGGTEIWSFRAIGAGAAKISFIYIRPWERDVEPANRVSFDIVVEDPAMEDTSGSVY